MDQDDYCVLRIRAGDKAALDELIIKYYNDILRYCYFHVNNKNDMEDATQDTFVKVIRYLDSYESRGKFRSFLYRIAANICIDYCRRKQIDYLCDNTGYIDENIELFDGNSCFAWCIRNLPPEQKEVIILRFSSGLKMREIAATMGIPIRTVQSRLRLALKRVKTEYQNEDNKNE